MGTPGELVLPVELYVLIIHWLSDDVTELARLILTCQTFRAIVEPLIYRVIYFRAGRTTLGSLCKVLRRRQLAPVVTFFDFDYTRPSLEHKSIAEGIASLSDVHLLPMVGRTLKAMVNLHTLVLPEWELFEKAPWLSEELNFYCPALRALKCPDCDLALRLIERHPHLIAIELLSSSSLFPFAISRPSGTSQPRPLKYYGGSIRQLTNLLHDSLGPDPIFRLVSGASLRICSATGDAMSEFVRALRTWTDRGSRLAWLSMDPHKRDLKNILSMPTLPPFPRVDGLHLHDMGFWTVVYSAHAKWIATALRTLSESGTLHLAVSHKDQRSLSLEETVTKQFCTAVSASSEALQKIIFPWESVWTKDSGEWALDDCVVDRFQDPFYPESSAIDTITKSSI